MNIIAQSCKDAPFIKIAMNEKNKSGQIFKEEQKFYLLNYNVYFCYL